jgi:hypothetical protein
MILRLSNNRQHKNLDESPGLKSIQRMPMCATRRWELKEVQDLLAGLSQQPSRSGAQSDPGDAGKGGKQR